MDGGEVAKSGTFPPHISRSWGEIYPPSESIVGGKLPSHGGGGSAAGENFGFWHPPWWGGSIKFQHFPPPMGGKYQKFGSKSAAGENFGDFPPTHGGEPKFSESASPPSESIVGGKFLGFGPMGGCWNIVGGK